MINEISKQDQISWMRRLSQAALWSVNDNSPKWFVALLHDTNELIGDVEKLRRFSAELDSAESKIDYPTEIFVVGLGKHGKSTLINALFAEDVAPMDFLPKTWCFQRYIADDNGNRSANLFVQFPLQEQHAHLIGKLGEDTGLKQGILKKFSCDPSCASVIMDDEESRCVPGNSYSSPILEVEWNIQAPNALFKNLCVVDTHGLSQILGNHAHEMHLEWEYQRADAVIWVVAADKLEDAAIFKELNHFRRYAKCILLVLNRIDRVPNRREDVVKRAHELYGSYVTQIIPFCGTLARQASSTGEKELWQISGLYELHMAIKRHILSKSVFLRTRQQYCSLRQIQREYRRVLEQHLVEIQHNIKIHENAVKATAVIYKSTMEFVQNETERMSDECCSFAKTKLPNIELDDDQSTVLSKLSSAQISLMLSSFHENLQSMLINQYSKHLVSMRDISYQDSQYGATGAIASTSTLSRINDININVNLSNISLNINVSQHFWDRFTLWWQNLFDPGGAILRRIELTYDKRQEIDNQVSSAIYSHISQLKDRFLDKLSTINMDIVSDIEASFYKIGEADFLEQDAQQTQRKLDAYLVPSFFYYRPLLAMRKLKWRHHDHTIK